MLITELVEMRRRIEKLNGDLITKPIEVDALIIRLENILHPRICTVRCSNCIAENSGDAEWYRCDECGRRICPNCIKMEDIGDLCPKCHKKFMEG